MAGFPIRSDPLEGRPPCRPRPGQSRALQCPIRSYRESAKSDTLLACGVTKYGDATLTGNGTITTRILDPDDSDHTDGDTDGIKNDQIILDWGETSPVQNPDPASWNQSKLVADNLTLNVDFPGTSGSYAIASWYETLGESSGIIQGEFKEILLNGNPTRRIEIDYDGTPEHPNSVVITIRPAGLWILIQ